MIEEGLFQFIQQNAALQPFLNTAPTNPGIYIGFVPAGAAYPCIMFEVVSEVNDTTFDGPSGYVIRRFQFNCYGKDLANAPNSGAVGAKKLADALRKQLDGLTGTLPDGTKLFNAILDNALDIYNDGGQVFNVVQDYFLHFQRTDA